MYAVIKAGGRQYRVEEGQQLDVDLISGIRRGDVPARAAGRRRRRPRHPDQLSGASVAARVVGEAKGPKITAFNYKPKSNQRRRWGHRQRYSTVEITGISRG